MEVVKKKMEKLEANYTINELAMQALNIYLRAGEFISKNLVQTNYTSKENPNMHPKLEPQEEINVKLR